jgi:hypothetical protein
VEEGTIDNYAASPLRNFRIFTQEPMMMKRLLLFILLCFALVPAANANTSPTPVIAQVIISTGNDSLKSSISDSTKAPLEGDDYSQYRRDESSGGTWRWMIALDLVILMLILFAIMRRKKKK